MRSLIVVMFAAAATTQPDLQAHMLHFFTGYPFLVYGIIVVFACAEGPILSVIGGTLIKLGYIPFIPIYAALMIGDLVGDAFWYAMGYYFGHAFIRRFGHYVGVTERGVRRVSTVFHMHRHKILFVNKLTMGFGFTLATLITAGIAKIPFRQYMFVNALGQFFWTGFLIALGYFLGNAYTYVEEVTGVFGKVALVALFLAVVYALHEYKQFMTSRASVLLPA